MNTKYFAILFALFCNSLIYAQSNSFNRLFEKYENEEDITIVNISKAMFNLIPGNLRTGNVNIKEILPKMESMRILTSNNIDLKEKMAADFKLLIAKDKAYEELMSIKSGKSIITFNLKKKGDLVNELVMIVNEDKDFVVIQILGNFFLYDIKKIAEGVVG